MAKRYRKGTIPELDVTYVLETIKDDDFVAVGIITVKGTTATEEMRKHRSICGYGHSNIARKRARSYFPEANPALVTKIDSYEETATKEQLKVLKKLKRVTI